MYNIDYASVVKDSLDMRDVAKFYGLEVNRSGFACCPFHGERTPSFKCYSGDGGFYCFGCHAHGTVIDFVMQYFDLSFKEAMEKLNLDFNLGLPLGHRPTIRQLRRSQELSRKRKAEIEKKQQLDREYQDALSEWTRLDQQSRDYAPKSPGEELHPMFVEALKNLQCASQRLGDAEFAVNNYTKGVE